MSKRAHKWLSSYFLYETWRRPCTCLIYLPQTNPRQIEISLPFFFRKHDKRIQPVQYYKIKEIFMIACAMLQTTDESNTKQLYPPELLQLFQLVI